MRWCKKGHAYNTGPCPQCAVERTRAWNEANQERRRERRKEYKKTNPELACYQAMIARCYTPGTASYPRYGGRGVKVCDRWHGRGGFANFMADMGERPGPGYSIERDNGGGDYEPSNCRWATKKEQARNTNQNRMIEFNGRTMCLAEWAESAGVPYEVFRQRLLAGWTMERAVTQPYKQYKV